MACTELAVYKRSYISWQSSCQVFKRTPPRPSVCHVYYYSAWVCWGMKHSLYKMCPFRLMFTRKNHELPCTFKVQSTTEHWAKLVILINFLPIFLLYEKNPNIQKISTRMVCFKQFWSFTTVVLYGSLQINRFPIGKDCLDFHFMKAKLSTANILDRLLSLKHVCCACFRYVDI